MQQKLSSILTAVVLFLFFITNSFAVTTAKEYYQKACDYYDQKEFDEAAKMFEKAVELKPDNAISKKLVSTAPQLWQDSKEKLD